MQASRHDNHCFSRTALYSSGVSWRSEAPGMSNSYKILLVFELILRGALLVHWVKQFCLPKQDTQAYAAIVVPNFFYLILQWKIGLSSTPTYFLRKSLS